MVRICNCLFIFLNLLTLILSLLAIIALLRFHINGVTECQRALKTPLIITGTFFLVLSLIGLTGTICQITFLLRMYSFLTFLWIIGLIATMFFVIIVSKDGAGKKLYGIGFKEYRFGDYSNWLKEQVSDGKRWDQIKSCMVDAHACFRLTATKPDLKVEDFYKMELSPMESGCCKPPLYCGLEFKNATSWAMPKSGPAVPDSDCTTWSNAQGKLCYDCKSCKGGVLRGIRSQWWAFAKFMLFHVVASTVICCMSSCTRKNIQDSKYQHRAYFIFPVSAAGST